MSGEQELARDKGKRQERCILFQGQLVRKINAQATFKSKQQQEVVI